MNRLAFILVVCEIAYFVAVRVFLRIYAGDLFDRELLWTALRILSVVPLALIFLRLDRSAPTRPVSVPPCCLLATGMFLAPILTGDMRFTGPTRYLFAAASLVVGLR